MDFLIEFLGFVLNAIIIGMIAFALFSWAVSRYLERQVAPVLRELEEETLIPLTVEVDNNQYFCYNSVTKAFVCQGHDLKEIVQRFKLRYPDKSAAIYNGDETAVRTLRSQLKELSENSFSVGRSS
jgi:hypothetical protein